VRKKKYPLRVLCAVLILCLGAAAVSPGAYALTPEQEATLATSQRSMNNPGGSFRAPEAASRFWPFHPDTWNAAALIIGNAMEQLFLGNADADTVRRVMEYAPIVKDGELPARGPWDDTMQCILQDGTRDVYIVLRETGRPGVYELLTIHSPAWQGDVFWLPLNVEYDAAAGEIYGSHGEGLLNIGYDYNVSKHLIRSSANGWNRILGYNLLFDFIAPSLLFFFETQRFPFSYQGRDWMIQFWKGYYTLSNGAEIGIYEKDPGQPFFWDATGTPLDISMKLYQDDKLYFDYGTQHTWWTAGFRYGNPLTTPLLPASRLRLTGTIRFEDKGMLEAFLASFEKNRPANMTGYADGLLFVFDWQANK